MRNASGADRLTPGREQALELLVKSGAGERILRHGAAVEELALRLGLQAQCMGFGIDLALAGAGALLHDIARRRGAGHAEAGCSLLCGLGYPKVGAVILAHMDLPPDALCPPDERAIVFLADKLVEEDRRVTLEQRFAKAEERCAGDAAALAALRARMGAAGIVLAELGLSDRECLTL